MIRGGGGQNSFGDRGLSVEGNLGALDRGEITNTSSQQISLIFFLFPAALILEKF